MRSGVNIPVLCCCCCLFVAAAKPAVNVSSSLTSLLKEPYGVAVMLEAAVRCGRSSYSAAAAAVSVQAPAVQAFSLLVNRVLLTCAAALEDSHAQSLSSLQQVLVQDEMSKMRTAVFALEPDSNHDPASYAAEVAAAAKVGRAAAQQHRQQLRLRLASLLCSCVKAMAGQWQHMSWQNVLHGCCTIALLSFDVAEIEKNMQTAWTTAAEVTMLATKTCWQGAIQQPILDKLQQVMQHPIGHSLAAVVSTAELQTTLQLGSQLRSQPWQQVLSKAENRALSSSCLQLAGVVACLPLLDQAAGSSSSNTAGRSADRTKTTGRAAGNNSSSSSSSVASTEVEVQLACIAAAAPAVRLYGTVIEAALSNPCLFKSSTAEARAAGVQQLARQVKLSTADGTLATLPRQVQQQLDKGNWQYLGSAKHSPKVIGALLGNLNEHFDSFDWLCNRFETALISLQGALQLPQPVVQQLQQQTQDLASVMDDAAQLWVDLGDSGSEYNSGSDSDSEAGRNSRNSDPQAAYKAAHRRFRWVLNAEDKCATLGAVMQRWADAVTAQLPSRRCYSNPCCVSLREMSESNLVSGKVCCCGRCSAADKAVRYCGKDCQRAHWPQHKPVCKRLQQLQQAPAVMQPTVHG
jgi:hypothetical protein